MALEKDRGGSSRAGSTGRVRRRSQLLRSSDSPSDPWGRCARPGRPLSTDRADTGGEALWKTRLLLRPAGEDCDQCSSLLQRLAAGTGAHDMLP